MRLQAAKHLCPGSWLDHSNEDIIQTKINKDTIQTKVNEDTIQFNAKPSYCITDVWAAPTIKQCYTNFILVSYLHIRLFCARVSKI